MQQSRSWFGRLLHSVATFFDSRHFDAPDADRGRYAIEPRQFVPYLITHGGCLGVIWVGWSWTAVAVAAFLYFLRMFAITGFYHRYFSHKTFDTSRFGQFLFALLGNSAAQRGPIWWASQHRRHHAHSDQPEDPHSPIEHSLYWAHFGWLTVRRNMVTDWRMVPDLAKYPELRFLDRFEGLVPFVLGFALFCLGWGLNVWFPSLGTSGLQMLVWGFFISTVVLFHATCTINSLAHWFGSRRFETKDASRNNVFLAFLTMGEGWHNNHHRYPGSTRQGFYWWEIDLTYYGLKMLSWVGLIWNLRKVPAHILEQGRTALANVKAAAEQLSSPQPAGMGA